jgi:hypothetical protein
LWWRRDSRDTSSRNRRTSRLESLARCARADKITGEEVNLISYLPAAVTTLFFLAANLLLGYLQ